MSRNRSAVAAAVKLAEAAPLFAALGDETRLKLVGRLCVDGPLSIARLSEGAGVTRQAVTKHLETLGDAGLVRHSRRLPGKSGRRSPVSLREQSPRRRCRRAVLIGKSWMDR